jgi:transcription antitermination factor NusA-like protein
MLTTIKVGYLVPFMVLKALPDYDSYFCNLIGTELYSLLPKKFSNRPYRVGETGWAAIMEIKPPRIILSQTSPQYVRKTIESRFHGILASNGLEIKRVATVRQADFFKVAVKSNNGVMTAREIYELFKPQEDTLKEHIGKKVYFVLFSHIKKQFAVNALAPAPIERVRKVIYFKGMESADIVVDSADVGLFLGRYKTNLTTAMKLTGVNISIHGM